LACSSRPPLRFLELEIVLFAQLFLPHELVVLHLELLVYMLLLLLESHIGGFLTNKGYQNL